MYFSWKVDVCWSLDSASQGEIPSQGNCVMFLVKTFHYFTEPLSAQVYKWALVNPEWTKRLIREVGGGGGNKDTPSDFKLCKQQTTKWTLPYTIISYLVSVQLHVQLLQVLFNCTKSCYEILKHKILEYDVLF